MRSLIRTALVSGLLLVMAPGSAGAADRPYVALGDSIGAGSGASTASKSYVGILSSAFQPNLGVTHLLNRSRAGETSGSLRTGGQLAAALADINAASDTAVVTLEIGGNDLLGGGACTNNWDEPSCPYRTNFEATLDDLAAALANDPGDEIFATTMYYNPASGTSSPQEANYDAQLFGANGVLGLTDTGEDVGLNDVIYQESVESTLAAANPYPAFHANGQAYMSPDHIHPNDAGHAAMAQAFCDAMAVSCAVAAQPQPSPPADTDPPETTITKGAPNKTDKSTVKFKFTSDEAGATFECKVDKKPFKPCSSPKKVKRLDEGKHRFKVRAIDAAGNVDPTVARDTFKVHRLTRLALARPLASSAAVIPKGLTSQLPPAYPRVGGRREPISGYTQLKTDDSRK